MITRYEDEITAFSDAELDAAIYEAEAEAAELESDGGADTYDFESLQLRLVALKGERGRREVP
jgi:hypothetical protein